MLKPQHGPPSEYFLQQQLQMRLGGYHWQRLQQFLGDQHVLKMDWVHSTILVCLLQWQKTASVNHTFPPTQSVASEEIDSPISR